MNQHISPLTGEAVDYSWRELLARAGGTIDELPIDVIYDDPEGSKESSIVVKPCTTKDWEELLEQELESLHWFPISEVIPGGASLPFERYVPVLFWGNEVRDRCRPFAELESNRTVVFNVDIIATTFFMLSRWEETLVTVRDEHDRFPATASVAYKQGFLDRPIVDEYALILREWIKVLLPDWKPKRQLFSIKLSHDIDHIRRFRSLFQLIRILGGDVIKRFSPTLALENGLDAINQFGKNRGSYLSNIYWLAELSRRCGLENSAFYFMTDGPDRVGAGYNLDDPLLQPVFDNLYDNNFEIGLHPGYDTYDDPIRLAAEKDQLESVSGRWVKGGRQHFLRFKVPDTWRHWEQVGMEYDSTVGYADHEGFRCGTCHPFKPFDIEQNRVINLTEIPLIVMDGTLCDYRDMSPEQGMKRILGLAEKCKQVEGVFTLLWHNSSFQGRWRGWAPMYQNVIKTLTDNLQAA
jgi:hypothetical protein